MSINFNKYKVTMGFLNVVKLNSGLYMVTGDSTETRISFSGLLTLENVTPQSFELFLVKKKSYLSL